MRFASKSLMGWASALVFFAGLAGFACRSPTPALFTLQGKVADDDGAPVPQAVIFAWPAGQDRTRVVEARSGDDGQFLLANLPAGAWALMVEAPGFGARQVDPVTVPGRPLVLRVQGEGRTMGGLVLRLDGAPVGSARVILNGPGLPAARRATTDGRGTFAFRGLGQGKFALRASAAGQASVAVTLTVDAATGWVPPARLVLAPAGLVKGRVTDGSGHALPGAEVEILATPSDDCPELASADSGGRFVLGPLPPGRYQVFARAPGFASPAPSEIRLSDSTAPDLALFLPKAAQVAGRVVDERGTGLAGVTATVFAAAVGVDDLSVLPRSLPMAAEAAVLPADKLLRQSLSRTATTDAAGRFVIVDLPPGRCRIEWVCDNRSAARRGPFLIDAGQHLQLADVALTPLRSATDAAAGR